MAKIPTVAIWDPESGRRIINTSDYDPDVHELYEDQGAVSPDPPVEVEVGPAPKLRVENTSPGWWKVLTDSDEQIGPAHRSEAEARQALREVVADG